VVSGGGEVGGLVGDNDDGSITNCYSTGAVNGGGSAGGLVGCLDGGSITACYSIGSVIGTHRSIGGLVGSEDGKITASFWDVETSGQTAGSGPGVAGLTTAEMQTASTFLDAGWDLIGETENGTDDIWWIDEGQDYPHLWWEKYGGGRGEPNDPYLIYTAEQMNQIGLHEEDWDKHFKLMVDIDLSTYTGTDYNIVGHVIEPWLEPWSKPFTGVFDGNGHTISNFTYTSANQDYIGLFGYLTGTVKDLGLVDVHVDIAQGCTIGGLAGAAEIGWSNIHRISNCYVTGYVSGEEEVGGLFGYAEYPAVEFCRSSAEVVGRESVGGLIGYCNDDLELCGSTATVRGQTQVGGLIGAFYGDELDECYSVSVVEGQQSVGGLVGKISYNTDVANCYAGGSVSGESNVGGLVGLAVCDADDCDAEEIWRCYSAAKVLATGDRAGGLVGANYTRIRNCVWDVEASGCSSMCGNLTPIKGCDDSFGRTTAEMQTAATFLELEFGWDFVDETDDRNDDVWWIDEGQDYPRLWWELISEN
jgi:hypothetical protein